MYSELPAPILLRSVFKNFQNHLTSIIEALSNLQKLSIDRKEAFFEKRPYAMFKREIFEKPTRRTVDRTVECQM